LLAFERIFVSRNLDPIVVSGFGDEWSRFDQSRLTPSERQAIFDEYFSDFPWSRLPSCAIGADFGCGSGRWAAVVAPRVGRLLCVDASCEALDVARRNLVDHDNCEFINASIGELPVPEASLDFAYSLGVLHHVPDTQQGLENCVTRLKPGAPFLVYLYYRFDNRPVLFRALWRVSDLVRRAVSVMPHGLRFLASQIIAIAVYWPLARLCRLGKFFGVDVRSWPLSYYSERSFYVMRTDALDRFGTRLEQRFTKAEIGKLMLDAGLQDIRFRDGAPYWCAIGFRGTI
jgi:SAM-dependent methyltransferase